MCASGVTVAGGKFRRTNKRRMAINLLGGTNGTSVLATFVRSVFGFLEKAISANRIVEF